MNFNKISRIFLASLFAYVMVYAFPQEKVEAAAFAPAVGAGGLTIGAGAYVGGAMILGGAAGILGYTEYQDEIDAHAAKVWSGATDLAKQGMDLTVDGAVGAGMAVQSLSTDTMDYLGTQAEGIASWIARLATAGSINYAGTEHFSKYKSSSGNVRLSFTNATSDIYINGVAASTISVTFGSYDGDGSISYVAVNDGYTYTLPDVPAFNYAVVQDAFNAATTLEGALDAVALYGVMVNIGAAEAVYQQSVSQTREAWQDMVDAGLVLPIDAAVSAVGDTLVNYDPTADTWTDSAGTVYNPADVNTWFPKPRAGTNTTTDEQLKVPGIPDVLVDTPTMTGNPALDTPRTDTGNPAYDGPATTTNVFTGEGITTGTTTANPTAPVENPTPSWTAKPSKQITFAPLLGGGSAMAQKFPFSIPWDLMKQLKVMDVAPVAPVFEVDVQDYLKIGKYTIPMKFDVDLTMFDPIAKIFRWGNLILFDIGLILMIRKLMPE